MTLEQVDEKKVTARGHLKNFAGLIRDTTTLIGAVSALYLAAANWLPNTSVGRGLTEFMDPIINPERLFEGFVYYEVGLDGGMTEFGQLQIETDGSLPLFGDLRRGLKLEAQSEVYLRRTPSTKEDYVRIFGAGQCFEVIKVDREITGDDLGDAMSGGWLGVKEASC